MATFITTIKFSKQSIKDIDHSTKPTAHAEVVAIVAG